MTYTHEQISPFLKLSKSGTQDSGPYTLLWHQGWADIHDASGAAVGQLTGEDFVKLSFIDAFTEVPK